jgi:hypothetical protein
MSVNRLYHPSFQQVIQLLSGLRITQLQNLIGWLSVPTSAKGFTWQDRRQDTREGERTDVVRLS